MTLGFKAQTEKTVRWPTLPPSVLTTSPTHHLKHLLPSNQFLEHIHTQVQVVDNLDFPWGNDILTRDQKFELTAPNLSSGILGMS